LLRRYRDGRSRSKLLLRLFRKYAGCASQLTVRTTGNIFDVLKINKYDQVS
jgi:hypothetical protein